MCNAGGKAFSAPLISASGANLATPLSVTVQILVPASSASAAAALLNYLNALSGQSKHILSSQHSSYWDFNPLDYEQAATNQTGKTVAGSTSGQEGSTENTVSLSNQWLAQGGIPLVSWWPLDPFTG